MKKFLSKVACVAVALVGAVSLVACGAMTNDYITSNRTAVIGEGETAVQFSNTDTFGLDYKGDNKYVAHGKANVMTQEQADAYWKDVATAGEYFVVISAKFDAGTKIVFGFEKEGADFETPDGTNVKKVENTTEEDDVLDIILRVQEDGAKTFRLISTEKDKDAVAYIVDFTNLEFTTAE